jgi:hypothetical protein
MDKRLGADVVVTKKRDLGLAPVIDSPLATVVVLVKREITDLTATKTKLTTEVATDSNKKDVVLTVTATSKKMVFTGQNSPSR